VASEELFSRFVEELRERMLRGEPVDTSIIDELVRENRRLYRQAVDEVHRALLDEEHRLLLELKRSLEAYNASLAPAAEGRERQPRRSEAAETTLAVVVREVPKFYGADGRLYGPYKPGDIILINKADHRLLRDRGYVREVRLDR